MRGTSSLTFIGIIAVLGSGRSYGIGTGLEDGKPPTKAADATSTAIYFTLGGSTRLGDAPEPTAPPSPPAPAPEEAVPAPAANPPVVAPSLQREEPRRQPK